MDFFLFWTHSQPSLQPINGTVLTKFTCIASLSLFPPLHYFSPGWGLPHFLSGHLPQSKSQSVVFRPAATTSPGNFLEVQILRPLPRPPESDSSGVEPREIWCNRRSRWFGHTLMIEKCYSTFCLSPVPLPEHSYFTCHCHKNFQSIVVLLFF